MSPVLPAVRCSPPRFWGGPWASRTLIGRAAGSGIGNLGLAFGQAVVGGRDVRSPEEAGLAGG